MNYYFAEEKGKRRHCGQRTTIVSTLNEDMKYTSEKFPEFQVRNLETREDLDHARALALDRVLWGKNFKTCN